MEQRTITETKIYALHLNPMEGNSENAIIVAVSTDYNQLIQWYKDQLAPEPYSDKGRPSFECHGDSHSWRKTFKKGSKLEWFNPCSNQDFELDYFGHGIAEHWCCLENLNPSVLFLG